MLSGLVMIVVLFGVIAAKYLTSVRLQQFRQRALEVEGATRAARGRLKQVENQSGVAGREVKTKQRKRTALEKQIAKYKKELAEIKR